MLLFFKLKFYCCGERLHLFGGGLLMVAEIHIARGIEGHKMDVGMRNIETLYCYANLLARDNPGEGFRHTLGKEMEVGVGSIVEVEDVVHFLLGDAEDMTFDYRIDIEEGKTGVGFCHFVAWDFSSHYS